MSVSYFLDMSYCYIIIVPRGRSKAKNTCINEIIYAYVDNVEYSLRFMSAYFYFFGKCSRANSKH